MISKLIKKFIYKERCNLSAFVFWMRPEGARIRTIVFTPRHTAIDMTRHWHIDIGNDVHTTEGITILTHGYDCSVVKGKYGGLLGLLEK